MITSEGTIQESGILHSSLSIEPSSTLSSSFASRSTLKGDESVSSKHAEQSFIERRRMFTVLYNNIDLTPDDITDPSFATMDESAKHAAFATKTAFKEEVQARGSFSKSKMTVTSDSANVKVFATTINLDDIHIDHTINTEEGPRETDIDLDQAPSAFYLSKMYPTRSYPREILVTLKETETCFLFDFPCLSYDKGSPEANIIEEQNVLYEYLTVGKGKNRKMVVEETQTEGVLSQSRHTLAVRPQKKNASSFASMWDMHDTYALLANQTEPPVEDEMVLYQSAAPNMLRKKKRQTTGIRSVRRGKTWEEIAETHEFLDAVLLVERVLASLEYDKAQKRFRGLVKIDLLSLDLVYIYTMKPLWTFEFDETINKPITSVSFNPKNENILAVAHGKYTYDEDCKGIVCIWCTKNPMKPERLYHFECPVTSVAFSEKNPNWLACGFWNGDVITLDITSYTIKTMATSSRETNPCFEPIWVTKWCPLDKDNEYLMTACQDGRINKFTSTKTHEFICSPMMRVSTVEGKLKGLEIPKACAKMDVPITRYPGVMSMLWHPTINHIYLVGTVEGCIHKCSTHYLNQHIDVFRYHTGPIYDIALSPFHQSLIITAGADGTVRFWYDGMDDMILSLSCGAAVHGTAFCPINSTIVLCVSGNVCSIWDLRRKTHMPCTEYTFHPSVILTYVHFSKSGENVFIGDTQGRMYTFHLEDTPIAPYYQRIMLDEALRKALCTRPQLMKQYDKLEKMRK